MSYLETLPFKLQVWFGITPSLSKARSHITQPNPQATETAWPQGPLGSKRSEDEIQNTVVI